MPRICINLTFDDATDQAVRTLWQRIADVGIPVKGRTGYRPHILLSAYEDTDLLPYETALGSIVSSMSPFPIRMDHLSIFPESGAVVLTPRMSQAMFSLHRAVIEAFAQAGRPQPQEAHSLPDLWVPHCTLAGGLSPTQIQAVLYACLPTWTPIRGQATGIGVRMQPAIVDHCHYSFPSAR